MILTFFKLIFKIIIVFIRKYIQFIVCSIKFKFEQQRRTNDEGVRRSQLGH